MVTEVSVGNAVEVAPTKIGCPAVIVEPAVVVAVNAVSVWKFTIALLVVDCVVIVTVLLNVAAPFTTSEPVTLKFPPILTF